MATLTFLGAVEGVTGSCYLLETNSATLLLECGLIQGGRKEELANTEPFSFDVDRLDAVVLSHAHLDHSGRLPKLVADGYNGPIYMTQATRALLAILLKDAVSLEMRDTEWENIRRRRSGKPAIEPLYTLDDVEQTLSLADGIPYHQRLPVCKGVEVNYLDAGHILGSAIVELYINEDGREKKLVFSGDLGNSYMALLRDPETVEHADILLQESTYGDRNHLPLDETLQEFENIIIEASKSGGNILIPSFAVGRTQEIIFRLGELYQRGKIKQQAIYLDSPMAIETTEVYQHFEDSFNLEDSDTLRYFSAGDLHSFLPILRYTRTTEESMALNKIAEGAIIIAGSGMCNGGRIRHHLKHNLWRNNAHVIIVGYQTMGTPGRALVDGAKHLRTVGEDITVNATIHTLGGFSAHAGQSQLIEWANHFKTPRPQLFLVHGEDEAKNALKTHLARQDWDATIPLMGDSVSF